MDVVGENWIRHFCHQWLVEEFCTQSGNVRDQLGRAKRQLLPKRVLESLVWIPWYVGFFRSEERAVPNRQTLVYRVNKPKGNERKRLLRVDERAD